MKERIVKQWADETLSQQGGENYELVRPCSFTGVKFTAKSDKEALKACPKISRAMAEQNKGEEG